jgi:methanogenic corrinoid protein MtbC1
MAELSPYFRPLDQPHGYRALLTCAAGEQHDLGLRMVAAMLERDGWDVLMLGANTPPEDVLSLLACHRPHLLGLSATVLENAGTLLELAARVRDRWPELPVLAGGQAFLLQPELCRDAGATAIATDAAEAVRRASELVGVVAG